MVDFSSPGFKEYSLLTAAKAVISKYAVFSGRATRSEYWYWVLGQGAVLLLLEMIMTMSMIVIFVRNDSQPMPPYEVFMYCLAAGVPLLLWSLATLIPSLAVTCRRLHDTGRSGTLLLLYLVPLIGGILLLIYCCEDSQRGTNQYGPSEKYPDLP